MLAVTESEFGYWIMVHYFVSLQFSKGGDNNTFNKGTNFTLLLDFSNISQLLT